MTRTKQDVFNEVWTKITAQGRASMMDGACVYRGDDGSACAIGCLIDDETAQRLPNWAVDEIEPELLPDWMRPMQYFLGAIQTAHDFATPIDGLTPPFLSEFHRRMRAIAASENLTVPT